MINVAANNSNVKGSQELNSPFRNLNPNKNIAVKIVMLKESTNHDNSTKIRRDILCIR